MSKTLHFKITLIRSNPQIWRQFQVRDDYRMDRFHQVLQIVMGWNNSHLHEFHFQDRIIAMLLEDNYDLPDPEDETRLYLNDFPLKQIDKFLYHYDFGDGWEHIIQLEKITDTVLPNPICTDGENACPPDDCGGIGGYGDLLEILKNPSDDEYDSWIEWLPKNFDPARFPLDKVNKELKKFGSWHQKHPDAKSTPWHQI